MRKIAQSVSLFIHNFLRVARAYYCIDGSLKAWPGFVMAKRASLIGCHWVIEHRRHSLMFTGIVFFILVVKFKCSLCMYVCMYLSICLSVCLSIYLSI